MNFADTTYTISIMPFILVSLVALVIGILSGISIANSKNRKKEERK